MKLAAMRTKQVWLASAALLSVAISSRGELVERVAAVVNKDIIALSELERRAAPELAAAASERDVGRRATKRNEVLHEMLDVMIGEKLMDSAAKESNVEVTEQDVDTAIEDVKKSHNLDQQRLEEAVRSEGMTIAKYREVVRGQVARLKLIQQKVRSRVKVTEQDVRSEYDKYVKLQQDDPEVHIRHIVLQLDANASPQQVEAARQKAQAIAEEARRPGVDFATLAKQKSEGASAPEGGDIGFFKHGVMLPEYEKVAFKLKPGEVSDPVRTDKGWHVIKVEEIRDASVKSYEQMKDVLREQLARTQLDRATQAYVQELRQAAVVDVKI